MLRFGMLSLICSMSFGVFGFGAGLSTSWVGGQILFLVCLVLSAIGFLGGVLANPTGLRESRIDDRSSYGRPAKDLHGEEYREPHNAPRSIQEERENPGSVSSSPAHSLRGIVARSASALPTLRATLL